MHLVHVRWFLLFSFVNLIFTFELRAAPPGDGAGLRFSEVAQQAGIQFQHHKPRLDPQLESIMNWMTSVGAAAAAADFDRDGWIDLYVTDSGQGFPNHLYRNNRNGTFTDVAKKAGVADVNNAEGTSMDCVWGDIDNDGWPDLYVVRWGRDVLFRNNGNGTFSDLTAKVFRRSSGEPGTDWKNGNAAVFLDYDLDGRLDLYVGNYFADHNLYRLSTTRVMHDDFEIARNGGRNQLFHQLPNGQFEERAASAGVDDPGWTLATGAGDLNNDGWPDLYVANDFGPDQLFLNRGDGSFANVTQEAIGPDTKKGMNAELADFNNDGWLDIYVTNITTADYLQEGNMMWLNNGAAEDGSVSFVDVSREAGTWDGGWGWAAKFFDADNDGDLDLYAANGFISAGAGNYWYDLAAWTVLDQDPADARNWPAIGDRSFSGFEKKRFFRNEDGLSFTERAAAVGLASDRDGRGIVVLDYDNDGDLDLYLANQGQPPQLFRNDSVRANPWLRLRLEGDVSTGVNRDAIGARVTLETNGGKQIRERDGGNGFASQSDARLHFGLGHSTVQSVRVEWPDGGVQVVTVVGLNREILVRQSRAGYISQATRVARTGARERGGEDPAAPNQASSIAEQLAELERQIESGSTSWRLASRYRDLAAKHGVFDRQLAFLESLVKSRPTDLRLKVQLAAAYVDKLPTCGGVAAIVCKGKLARKALDLCDAVVRADPHLWAGLYSRGINHLHWPRALRHSDDAVADLEATVALQERQPGPAPAFFLRAYVALGDAYVKNGEVEKGRIAWRRGLKVFPAAAELTERLGNDEQSAVLVFVDQKRSLQQPIDTDFSFLDRD